VGLVKLNVIFAAMSNDLDELDLPEPGEESGNLTENERLISLAGMYENYFLDYASYVILERAVPAIEDGLKPVQRRILHSMMELEDGRYNKVANVIGNTMKYHPHGDASITDAMVQLGQKNLLIDTQGNWGNPLTGDSAAAARYIEARLTPFAKEVVFNPKTTPWQLSYDGRNKEPITLPVKFPLLLAHGVEGIAVGLACKILPHNFIELLDASVDILKGRTPVLYPDFSSGGFIEVSKYNQGLRGGKVRVRAKMNGLDSKTIIITEIPFGTTTGGLIDSILNANDKGKIKIKKVEDNTAENVEILVHLPTGVSVDQTIDALYAFTDCETSISPNSGVIVNNKPLFLDIIDLLQYSTRNTMGLLELELNIRKGELNEDILYTSLEKIFIENRIYRDIEECETWDEIIQTIDRGLEPFKQSFYREITTKDIEKLTEIKIKRISKFDGFKADEKLKVLQTEKEHVEHHLNHLTEYAIDWFKNLKKKYGKGRERKTEIRSFEAIEAVKVVARTEKLMVDFDNGFAGYGLKNATFITECSDIDDIIVFREDGTMLITRISDKVYVGKPIVHIAVWNRDDKRTVYHLIYRDGATGPLFMKRFNVNAATRDKEYCLTRGTKNSKVIYFSANPNGESEVLTIYLKPRPKLRKQIYDINLGELAIKGRNSQGNVLSKFPVRKIVCKSKGESTLGALQYWFDEETRRLNAEGRGGLLGSFAQGDRLIEITRNGSYRLVKPELTLHFEPDSLIIAKYYNGTPLSIVYNDGERKTVFIKRFIPETLEKYVQVVSLHKDTRVLAASIDARPVLEVHFLSEPRKEKSSKTFSLEDFSTVKGEKAVGSKLNLPSIKQCTWLDPLAHEYEPQNSELPVEEEPAEDVNVKEINLDENDGQMSLF
jgi:topoisomerase-4 subunit A